MKMVTTKTQLPGSIVAIAIMILVPSSVARPDFVLDGSDYLEVTESHSVGVLWDISMADVKQGGSISEAYLNDDALLRVLGGDISYLYAYNTSSVNVLGGHLWYLLTYNASNADISDGEVSYSVWTYHTSSAYISGGTIYQVNTRNDSSARITGGTFPIGLYAYDSSNVDISGGSFLNVTARNDSSVNISGGSMSDLRAWDTGNVTFHGYDFRATGGLSIDGNKVLGTGVLTGKWSDGTTWAIPISSHDAAATVWVIPEPSSLSLVVIGGMALLRRRVARHSLYGVRLFVAPGSKARDVRYAHMDVAICVKDVLRVQTSCTLRQ